MDENQQRQQLMTRLEVLVFAPKENEVMLGMSDEILDRLDDFENAVKNAVRQIAESNAFQDIQPFTVKFF